MKEFDTESADIVFSKLIRRRDAICVRCRRRIATDCSHFWERGNSATRYDPENCDGLCRSCHQIWEGRLNGYIEYKKEQLGEEKYTALEKKHHSIMSRYDALQEFSQKYDGYKKNKHLL